MNRGKFISFLFLLNFYFIEGSKNKNIRKLQELSDDIVILHVNDVHCAINKTIGYDGFALYRNEMKKKYKNVILVDVGDHIQGGSIGAISKGETIIKLMNKIEFNVVTIGNHEFDYGIDQLYKLGNDLSSKYICSNFCFRKNKTTIFDPYKIIEAGNKKIGFIGVLIPSAFSKTYLSSLKDENNEPIYDLLADNNEKNLFENVQANINILKNDKKVDYIVLLTHIGLSLEEFNSQVLLSKLENVDIVIDGNTHEIYNTTIKDKNNKEIQIVQTGNKLESIGQIIIKKNGIITSEIIESVPEPNDKEGSMNIYRDGQKRWVDKEINIYIDNIWKNYSDELNKLIIGHSNFDFLINSESNNLCKYQEYTLGNLIADAMKNSSNADIAILNGGAVANILKGNLTIGQIIDVILWYYKILVKRVPGQVILDALEFGVQDLSKTSNGFPQVSGLTFDLNIDIDSSVKTENDKFININRKRRVSNVKVNGKDLNLNKLYKVSLLEFIANGGDEYSMLTNYSVHNESKHTNTDSLISYIKNNLNHEIPTELQRRLDEEFPLNSDSIYALLPNIIIIGFNSYQFTENPYMIKFNVVASIPIFPEYVHSITIKVDIVYNRLRFLEEEEIYCLKIKSMSFFIYIFACSKEVNGPISSISLITDSIILNGDTQLNSSTSGVAKNEEDNIQNQTISSFLGRRKSDFTFKNCSVYAENNKLIFEGDNDVITISSSFSLLSFVQGDILENIVCDISDEGNNKFKMVCEAKSNIKADFFGNNGIDLSNFDKDIMMEFQEGKSFVYLEVGDKKNLNLFKKTKTIRTSSFLITVLIILIICFLALIIIIARLCSKLCSIKKKIVKIQAILPNFEKDKTTSAFQIPKNKDSNQEINQV